MFSEDWISLYQYGKRLHYYNDKYPCIGFYPKDEKHKFYFEPDEDMPNKPIRDIKKYYMEKL